MTSKIRKAFDKAYATLLDMLARVVSRLTGAFIPLGLPAKPPWKQVVTHEQHVHAAAGKDAGEDFADEFRRQQAAQAYTDNHPMIVTVKCPVCAEPVDIDVVFDPKVSDLGHQAIREHTATHA